jgi:hypothetical protein
LLYSKKKQDQTDISLLCAQTALDLFAKLAISEFQKQTIPHNFTRSQTWGHLIA